MKIVVAAVLLAASLAGVTVPATAYADESVPTVDQVVAVMAELTDPGRPAASKTDIVTPGFAPDEAGTIPREPPWPPPTPFPTTPFTLARLCWSVRAGTG
jgi:hypothetical protein